MKVEVVNVAAEHRSLDKVCAYRRFSGKVYVGKQEKWSNEVKIK